MNIEIPEFELEVSCWECYGSGRKGAKKCEHCDGTGSLITADGRKVLDFLKKYWNVGVKP